jgi:hypothetical protein
VGKGVKGETVFGFADWKVCKLQGCDRTNPRFFVTIASKGVNSAVSLLFAIFVRELVSVAVKGLKAASCWREGNALGWDDFGRV